jgi:putative SOS response-associated peptidase YedK
MCARITITTTSAELADLFGLAHDDRQPSQPRYNVAPSRPVPVVRAAGDTRELVSLRWGLVPHWSREPKGYVNARAELVTTKPAFRAPVRSRRCIVPIDGFFEWETVGKSKVPYFFRRAGGGVLALAALWDRWDGSSGPLETVAILTVPANELVQPYHDRMPAILEAGQFGTWLGGKLPDALALLRPYPVELLEAWRVSEQVNSVKNDGPELLLPVPVQPRPVQPSLFDVVA